MSTHENSFLPSDLQLLEQAVQDYRCLSEQISRVIIGQERAIRLLLAAIFAQGHVLIIGVPGLAKTLLVKTLARTLGWHFKRIQFTPDMMPADIIGMELLQEDPTGGTRSMRFVPGPVFANIILADEINRTPPKTQSALLEAMQEYTVTSMGRSYALDRPFIVVATQNPIEQEGTYPLPEAQLDRFMFSLPMDYPSSDEEERMVEATTASAGVEVQQVFSREQIMRYQDLVRRVPASKHVIAYAVAVTRATRPNVSNSSIPLVHQYVEWGAGPRAAQHLVLAAKALAVLEGQAAVTTQHVRQAAPMILRHRVIPNYHATGEDISADAVVTQVLQHVPEPAYDRG